MIKSEIVVTGPIHKRSIAITEKRCLDFFGSFDIEFFFLYDFPEKR